MPQRLATLHEHTVDLSLLTGGIAIDAGCRGWLFSNEMKSLGENVFAFDVEDMEAPEGIHFVKCAIMGVTEKVFIIYSADKNATRVVKANGNSDVDGMKLNLLLSSLGTVADLLKLDIEGSEIDALMSLQADNYCLPKQISVEFHIHTGTPMIDIRKVFTHLNDIGYTKVFEDYSEKHGLCKNYWDVLFIKSDLC